LSGATLTRAILIEANLSGAILSVAYLYHANLTGADLGGAHLNGADLSGANLTEASLNGADFGRLTGAQPLGLKYGARLSEHGDQPAQCFVRVLVPRPDRAHVPSLDLKGQRITFDVCYRGQPMTDAFSDHGEQLAGLDDVRYNREKWHANRDVTFKPSLRQGVIDYPGLTGDGEVGQRGKLL